MSLSFVGAVCPIATSKGSTKGPRVIPPYSDRGSGQGAVARVFDASVGAAAADKLSEMKPAQKTVISAIEETEMSDAERAARLEALWSRMLDPDGLDWETLENIEPLTERSR